MDRRAFAELRASGALASFLQPAAPMVLALPTGMTVKFGRHEVAQRLSLQLHRRPGVPTAMMPFYGATPPEAAQRLTDWLTMAHANGAAVRSFSSQRIPSKSKWLVGSSRSSTSGS